MKDRHKRMLRFLLTNQSILRIDDLAETFSIGKRTVSRDLDVIERWLSLRGGLLERKPNQGIQVITFGKDPGDLLQTLNTPESYIETLPPATRRDLILLFLIFNNREIKIAEIAHAFFISDTSVWNDLNQIETATASFGFTLIRLKGVGIRLTGEESALRMHFLKILTELFSSRTIIPYIYALKEENAYSLDVNQFKLLLKKIHFPANNTAILRMIYEVKDILGYQFTMSGETLLYFYLQLCSHRIKSGALVQKSPETRCLKKYKETGRDLLQSLTERIFSGKLPPEEVEFLGLLLQVLEIGNLPAGKVRDYAGELDRRIPDFTGKMISRFGTLDGELYYLNEEMEGILNLAVASLVTRLRNQIPSWHGDWGEASPEEWNRREKKELLNRMMKEAFGLEAGERELDNLLILFQSLVLENQDLPEYKIRCLVCCFEGIGLASYLHSLLKKEFQQLDVVESTAVSTISQEYLDSKKIELVLSTYSQNNLRTPVIPISLPLNKESLKATISGMISTIRRAEPPEENQRADREPSAEGEISFESLLQFIHHFRMIDLPPSESIEEIIDALAESLTEHSSEGAELAASFKKREDLGPLFFEDYGLRVLHCKTDALQEPAAGVIRFNQEDNPRMLYLVAPDPCPDPVRKMLSEITLSFLENNSFRQAVLTGGLNRIRKELMDIYKELI